MVDALASDYCVPVGKPVHYPAAHGVLASKHLFEQPVAGG